MHRLSKDKFIQDHLNSPQVTLLIGSATQQMFAIPLAEAKSILIMTLRTAFGNDAVARSASDFIVHLKDIVSKIDPSFDPMQFFSLIDREWLEYDASQNKLVPGSETDTFSERKT